MTKNMKISKYKVSRLLNILFCFILMIYIMIKIYQEWSMFGVYTIFSFVASFIIHGTIIGFIYLTIDYVLRKHFKK